MQNSKSTFAAACMLLYVNLHGLMARLWNEIPKNDSQPPSYLMASTLKPGKVKYSVSLVATDGQVT